MGACKSGVLSTAQEVEAISRDFITRMSTSNVARGHLCDNVAENLHPDPVLGICMKLHLKRNRGASLVKKISSPHNIESVAG